VTAAAGWPVRWWPGVIDPREELVVVGIGAGPNGGPLPLPAPSGGQRDAARARIRAVLREALGQLAGVPPGAVMIQSRPGFAPAVSYPGGAPAPAISITHDEPWSLAAIRRHGPVGIDLMRVQEFPDWRAVALDYLGPAAASRLDAAGPAHRAASFARAWTAHEARLKALGLQLAEWTPRLENRLAACQCHELALPAGVVGALAWPA
jgi:4'-phosphopantetheinyl transferase